MALVQLRPSQHFSRSCRDEKSPDVSLARGREESDRIFSICFLLKRKWVSSQKAFWPLYCPATPNSPKSTIHFVESLNCWAFFFFLFLFLFYIPSLVNSKSVVSGFHSWKVGKCSVLGELTGEAGGCLVRERLWRTLGSGSTRAATSRGVEISPHIGPLCIFTSTQPHSTPLNFILRRGPLERSVAPFVGAALLMKIAAEDWAKYWHWLSTSSLVLISRGSLASSHEGSLCEKKKKQQKKKNTTNSPHGFLKRLFPKNTFLWILHKNGYGRV